MASESAYQEFTGKSVEEALKIACESFKVGLADLDFEIIAPGSKGVLGMGAEPARIVAAPASAIAGSTPKRATEPTKPVISVTGICEILYLRMRSMACETNSSVRTTTKG